MAAVGRVLIVGGGIAGMALAISLQRAGSAAEIVEIDRDWRVYGAGITVTGPTLRAFDQLGLLHQVEAEGFCSESARICDMDGNIVVASRVTGRPLGPRIPNAGGILRPVLHGILSQATRISGANVRLGVSVRSIEPGANAADVEFTDGSSGRYDLVVGADGVHSAVRRMVFPGSPEPELTGQGCWRAVAVRPAEIDRAHVFIGGPVKAGVTPVSRDEMYLFLLQTVAGDVRMPEERWPQLLAEQLRGFGSVLGTIRDSLNASARINYRPLQKFLLPAPWHSGRVVLIGDAAHATTPHLASGAGLAIEDAIVLSESLQSTRTVASALDAFLQRRYERCRTVVESSVQLGEMEMLGAAIREQAELSRRSFEALNAPI